MLITGFLSVVIIALGKELGETFHPFQVMFFYCAIGALWLLPVYLIKSKTKTALKTIRWLYHIIRAVCEFTAFSLTFYAIKTLPLPMQAAISYTVPIFASLFAVLLVGEVVDRRIVLSLLLGTVGICIIHNPLTFQLHDALSLGILACIAAAAIFGICGSMIKLSTRTTPPILIALIMLILTAIIAAPFAISVWVMPRAEHLALLLVFGLCTASVQFAVSKALTLGEITRLMPISYLNLIWATLIGYVFFDELIEARTIFGSIFILAAVTIVTYKRRKNKIAATVITNQP